MSGLRGSLRTRNNLLVRLCTLLLVGSQSDYTDHFAPETDIQILVSRPLWSKDFNVCGVYQAETTAAGNKLIHHHTPVVVWRAASDI